MALAARVERPTHLQPVETTPRDGDWDADFSRLATRLLPAIDDGFRSVAFISGQSGEGVTTVVHQLATRMAGSGSSSSMRTCASRNCIDASAAHGARASQSSSTGASTSVTSPSAYPGCT